MNRMSKFIFIKTIFITCLFIHIVFIANEIEIKNEIHFILIFCKQKNDFNVIQN